MVGIALIYWGVCWVLYKDLGGTGVICRIFKVKVFLVVALSLYRGILDIRPSGVI